MQRWNLPEGWVISNQPAHPALVSEADFIAAQDATAPRGPAGPAAAAVPAGRAAGLRDLRAAAGIGLVQRQARLPVPPRPHQRHPPGPGRPKNTYVREDQILPHLAAIAILLARQAARRPAAAPRRSPPPRGPRT